MDTSVARRPSLESLKNLKMDRKTSSEAELDLSSLSLSPDGPAPPYVSVLESQHIVVDESPLIQNGVATTPTYSYVPLKAGEIRLLKLFPSVQGGTDEFRGGLVNIHIDHAPEYEALSYYWGTEPTVEYIIIDGAKLFIKPNLLAALGMLRRSSISQGSQPEPRMLWIDAICINQVDQVERSQQVGFMCQIYSQLSRLFVWLGDSDQDSRQVISAIRSAELDLKDVECITKQGLPEIFSLELMNTTHRFFQRPWFSRAWIVQEFVLGGLNITIQVGEEKLSGLELDALSDWYMSSDMQDEIAFSLNDTWGYMKLAQDEFYKTKRTAYSSLVYWLERIRYTLATDPRDKVFATFGLVERHSDDSSLDLTALVSYEASIQDVYSHLVKALVISTGKLEILLSCGLRSPEIARSWVPDWSTEQGNRMIRPGENYTFINGKTFIFKASLKTAAAVSFSDSVEIMNVRGFVVDTVSCCSSLNKGAYTSRQEQLVLWMLEKLVGDAENIPAKAVETLQQTSSVLQASQNFVLSNKESGRSSYSIPRKDIVSSFSEHMFVFQTYFFTSKGYLGRDFSAVIEEGDLICILFGCPVPVALREHKNGDNVWYEFLRCVYVDGLMFGEAMGMENIVAVDFELR